MAAPSCRRLSIVCALALALASPTPISAQDTGLVYISNVTGTEAGGATLTTVEEQTAAALDHLGEALQEHGLTYSDVVVSNVFLRDTRHFQGMNGVYRTYFQISPPTRATVQAATTQIRSRVTGTSRL